MASSNRHDAGAMQRPEDALATCDRRSVLATDHENNLLPPPVHLPERQLT